MKNPRHLLFLVLVLPAALQVACDRHGARQAPLTPAQCEPYCERVTACTDVSVKLMAGRGNLSPESQQGAAKLKSQKACLASCRDQLDPSLAEKYPISHKFYQFVLRRQMSCLEHEDCGKFSVCRQAQLAKAIAEYPMDTTDARRCDETCDRVSQCAAELVPRVYLAEYDRLPLDARAEMVRRHGDRDRCLQSCRYSSIKARLDKRKMGSAQDENWVDLQPFMQCLAHTDCKEFTQCVVSQSAAPI
jgi:hypothetical protein